MRVCLITCNPRHSAAGDRIAAVAEHLEDATIVTTRSGDWPGATHIDELSGSFDAAVAIGWQACLHVFRPDAQRYAYYVPAMQDALLWHGDERRLLATLTYDLPLTLIAPSRAVAKALEDHARGRNVVIVEPGIPRPEEGSDPLHRRNLHLRKGSDPSPGGGSRGSLLRVASALPADEILGRASSQVELADLDDADVLLELGAADSPLTEAPRAMLAGVVPVVTPVDGHDELITDGQDGIVVGFDDVPGTARALDTLAADRDLLATLRDGALERAQRFPTLQDEAAALVSALEDATPPDGWPARLLLNARAAAEPIAQERRALDQVLREQEQRVLGLAADNERLTLELDRQAAAYKVGKKLEPLWRPLMRLRKKR
jgi:hypothetical protein